MRSQATKNCGHKRPKIAVTSDPPPLLDGCFHGIALLGRFCDWPFSANFCDHKGSNSMIAACSEVSSVLASLTDFLDSHAVLGPVWSHSSSIATIEGYEVSVCTLLLLVPCTTFCNWTAGRGKPFWQRELCEHCQFDWPLGLHWVLFPPHSVTTSATSAFSASSLPDFRMRYVLQFHRWDFSIQLHYRRAGSVCDNIVWTSTAVRTALCWASLRWQNSSRPDWQAVCPKW